MFRRDRASALAAAAVAAVGLAACGNSGAGGGSNKGDKAQTAAPSNAKNGGKLTVLYNGDVDYIDPGATYYQYGFNVAYATQRPLFSYRPDSVKAVPDLADGQAKISPDGKTVTVKIKKGVRFSPPVNRAVTSKDVKYAIERGFITGVQNGYATTYLSEIVGAPAKPKPKHTDIEGLQTPDDQTLVIKLTKPRGQVVVGALSLPLSAPVPPEYAAKFDAKNPSSYGNNQVATGPYMIKNDAQGKAVGYKPQRSIDLVRNPNWDKATDFKPAYVNSILVKEGLDPTVASRGIASGKGEVSGDFQLPTDFLKRGTQGELKDQFLVSPPTGRVRYVALNTKIKPFNDLNLRRAVVAAFDRDALRRAFGGPTTGLLATHFIPPGIDGFEQGGGKKGPSADFVQNPKGDMALAKKYMKKAGYPSGKYTGKQKLLMVVDNATQQKKVGEVVQNQLSKLGFQINPRFVSRDTMYTSFCSVPGKKVPICPSVGWLKDFPDPETMLDATFSGKNIQTVNNSNWPQLDVKKIDTAMRRAEVLQEPAQRGKVWGQIDREIVDQAPAIPWLWDTQALLKSKDVAGVVNKANAAFDFNFTSIKK